LEEDTVGLVFLDLDLEPICRKFRASGSDELVLGVLSIVSSVSRRQRLG